LYKYCKLIITLKKFGGKSCLVRTFCCCPKRKDKRIEKKYLPSPSLSLSLSLSLPTPSHSLSLSLSKRSKGFFPMNFKKAFFRRDKHSVATPSPPFQSFGTTENGNCPKTGLNIFIRIFVLNKVWKRNLMKTNWLEIADSFTHKKMKFWWDILSD